MGSVHPQLDFLATFSEASLESFELSRMNLVANLRKELHQVVDEWIEAEIESRIARWILQSRGTVPNDPRSLSSDRIDKPLPAADAFGAFGRSTAIEGSETTASHSIKNALPPPRRPGIRRPIERGKPFGGAVRMPVQSSLFPEKASRFRGKETDEHAASSPVNIDRAGETFRSLEHFARSRNGDPWRVHRAPVRTDRSRAAPSAVGHLFSAVCSASDVFTAHFTRVLARCSNSCSPVHLG